MMQVHVDKSQANKGRSVADEMFHKETGHNPDFHFADNRPQAVAQRKLQELANSSLQAKPPVQLKQSAESDVVQLYTEETMRAQHQSIKAATGSGGAVLKENKNAQEALGSDEDEGKQLTPYFTTMGFEVEFAQQPVPNKHNPPKNTLSKAHIIVSKGGGFSLFPKPDFVIETDAALALEFVTSPMLAPLEDGEDGKVKPDPTWENEARKAIEFSLRDMAKREASVKGLVNEINRAFGLSLSAPESDVEDIRYGNIDKLGPKSHTNAQLNYMTTLEHYMELNRSGDGGDSVTEEIFQLAMTALKEYQSLYFGTEEEEVVPSANLYALSQKLREIPSILVDQTFSILLHKDKEPESEAFTDREAGSKENNRVVEKSLEQATYRSTLAGNASHIKDQSMVWLKASFAQILAGISKDDYEEVQEIFNDMDWSKIKGILMKTDQVKDALEPFYTAGQIGEFVDEELQQVRKLLEQKEYSRKSDIEDKPEEQRTLSDTRKDIIGARPDTYVKSDEEIGEKNLFLIETRKTTSYLDLEKNDRYKP